MQPKVGNFGPPPILQSVKSLPPSRWVEATAMTLHPEKGSSPVQFSRSLRSNSLQLHGMQHARPPCPSPTIGVYSTSCPVSQWCHPTISSSSSPAFNLSQHQGLFKWVSSSHQVAKYWSFSFSISPSNEYSGLISFRMDWLDLLAVQGTLKSLLQTTVQKHQFFCAQLSL